MQKWIRSTTMRCALTQEKREARGCEKKERRNHRLTGLKTWGRLWQNAGGGNLRKTLNGASCLETGDDKGGKGSEKSWPESKV